MGGRAWVIAMALSAACRAAPPSDAVTLGMADTSAGSIAADDTTSTTGAPDRDPAPDVGGGLGDAHRFVDATVHAGLSQIVQVAERSLPFCLVDRASTLTPGDYCVPERLLGGGSVGDLDRDGDADLVFPSTDGATRVMLASSDGSFTLALAGFDPTHRAAGAALGDIDRDGDLDVYLAGFGTQRNYLYINRGDATFVDRALERGAAVESDAMHLGTTPVFGDVDLDGDLDLFVGEWRPDEELGNTTKHLALLRNLGPEQLGVFEDVTIAAGLELAAFEPPSDARPGVFAFAPAFVDFDGDRFPDLAIAGDFHTSKYFRNRGDFTFEDRTAETGIGSVYNGMGSAIGDLDGDGHLDWFVTAIAAGNAPTLGNRLFLGDGAGNFTDATLPWGVLDGGWGWGAVMFDHDNDGVLGLAMTAGWTQAEFADDRTRVWDRTDDGPMLEVAEALGLYDGGQGRGLVAFDYENDGDEDLLVSHWGAPPRLWRNEAAPGHWLRVRLRGTAGDLDGRHAVITIEVPGEAPRVHQVGAGSHLYGQGELVAHFGVGDATRVDVRVEWPVSGGVSMQTGVTVDRTIEVTEPDE